MCFLGSSFLFHFPLHDWCMCYQKSKWPELLSLPPVKAGLPSHDKFPALAGLVHHHYSQITPKIHLCNPSFLAPFLTTPQKVSRKRNGNPFQYSCQENPMDRGAWQATVCGGAKSLTQVSNWTTTESIMQLLSELTLAKHFRILIFTHLCYALDSKIWDFGLHILSNVFHASNVGHHI